MTFSTHFKSISPTLAYTCVALGAFWACQAVVAQPIDDSSQASEVWLLAQATETPPPQPKAAAPKPPARKRVVPVAKPIQVPVIRGSALEEAPPLLDVKTAEATDDDDAKAAKPIRWAVGTTLVSAPSYLGGGERKISLRPEASVQIGRWTLSTGSARRLSGAGEGGGGGASTTLLASDRWSMGLGLRMTRGRSTSDDPMLAGLPKVSASLAARLGVRYKLTDHWSALGGIQQDLLHGQGTKLSVGLGYTRPLSETWVFDAGVGAGWANSKAMNLYYGVPQAQANAMRRAWQPGAGMEQWNWGVGVSHKLTKHWRVAGSIGQTTLLGGAADSPIVTRRKGTTAQISAVYVAW